MFEGLFGSKHIWGLSVAVVLLTGFFVLFHFLNPKLTKEKGRKYVLRTIACVMVGLEFCKMVFILSGYGQASGIITYGQFPFHLCSMPLVLYPLVAFGKERTSRIFAPAAFIIGIVAGSITLIYPSNVLFGSPGNSDVSWWTDYGINFPMHSFIYHSLMVAFAGYMIQSKIYKIRAFDFVFASGVMLSLASVAMIMNAIIPNADYFMLGHGYGMPTQFIIESAGLPVYIITMLSIGIFVVFLVYSYWIIKALIIKVNAKKS